MACPLLCPTVLPPLRNQGGRTALIWNLWGAVFLTWAVCNGNYSMDVLEVADEAKGA